VRADIVRILMNVRIQTQQEIEAAEQRIEEESERRIELAQAQHSDFARVAEEPADAETLTLRSPMIRSAAVSSASATRSAATTRVL